MDSSGVTMAPMCLRTLKEGDPVAFDVIQGDKGPQADCVTRLEKMSQQVPG
jgi:cold shock CspA family protein